MKNDEKVLVLFSGGKASFLTACRLVEAGKHVILFSCNNGALAAEENLSHGAARLVNRYGADKIEYAGVYGTVGTVQLLMRGLTRCTIQHVGDTYPNLTLPQMQCLVCQTAMWAAAVAYAVGHKVPTIAAGYRKTDNFCTGLQAYSERITALAAEYGVDVVRPVWDTEEWDAPGGTSRDRELADHGFEPQVLEPKYMLGMPAVGRSLYEGDDIAKLYDGMLLPYLHDQIDHLVPVLKTIRLGKMAYAAPEYPVPDDSRGLY